MIHKATWIPRRPGSIAWEGTLWKIAAKSITQ